MVSLSLARMVVAEEDTPRTMRQRSSETANILDFFKVPDADWSNALDRAMDTGKRVDVPYNGGTVYEFASTFTLSTAGVRIRGTGGVAKIALTGASSRLFTITAANVEIENLEIDGSDPGLSSNRVIHFDAGASFGLVDNVRLINCEQGFGIYNGAHHITIRDWYVAGATMHGVTISNAHSSVVTRGEVVNCGGFGVILSTGSHRNEISFNRTEDNGIELVGVQSTCFLNKIIGNWAESCNDNGISVSGFLNLVSDNHCISNYHNGIAIYGNYNTVTGNVCLNNGQRYLVDSTVFAGLSFDPAFGGLAKGNVHFGNICSDTQGSPTQSYGILYNTNKYVQWTTGQVLTAGRNFRYFGNNIYLNESGGTCGVTAPVHTSGTVSDGGVNWEFIASGTPNLGANDNSGGGRAYGNRLANNTDLTSNANSFAAPGLVQMAGSDDTAVAARILVGSSAPSASQPAGDIYLRAGASSRYIAAYVRGDTAWTPIQLRSVGTTANRPTGLGSGFEGSQYWDSTTKKLMASAGVSNTLLDALGREDLKTVAAAGSDQAGATQLVYAHAAITSGTGGDRLPSPQIGWEMKVFNRTGSAVNIYPNTGHTIDSLSANVAYSLAAGASITFTALSTTAWAT